MSCEECQVCVECEKMCGICIECEVNYGAQRQEKTSATPIKPVFKVRQPSIDITDMQLKEMIREAVREGIREALVELGWKPEKKKFE
ncbi:MAG: hypothetical protein JTT12_05500 [Candidatus Brockarchaeota archaeon]|nr:hypothetical protein [Candidatus Brockarchaeota archaeon]